MIEAVFSHQSHDSMHSFVADIAGGTISEISMTGEVSESLPSCHEVLSERLPQTKGSRSQTMVTLPEEWVRAGATGIISLLVAGAMEFPGLRLESLKIPEKAWDAMAQPCLGKKAIRGLLGRPEGPLFGVALKPNIGLSLQERQAVAGALAAAGMDIIKDDEVAVGPPEEVIKRAGDIQRALNDISRRSTPSCYVPNITSDSITPKHLRRLAELGVRGAMLNYLVCGWSKVAELAANRPEGFFLYGHRTGHEVLLPHISMPVLALLGRLVGLDVMHIGTPQATKEALQGTNKILERINGFRGDDGVMPVFSKTSSELARWLVKELGQDIVVMACGPVYRNGDLKLNARRWIKEVIR